MKQHLLLGLACLAFAATHADIIPQQPLTFQGEEFRYVLVPFPNWDEKYGLVNKPFYKNSGTWITFNWHDTIKPALESLAWKEKFADSPQPVIFRYAHGEAELKKLMLPEIQNLVKSLGQRFVGLESLEGRWDPHKSFKTCKWPNLLKRSKPKTKAEAYDLVKTYFQTYLKHPLYPIVPGTCAFTPHHTARWGANAIVTYHGSNLLCGQIQNALARGAARQFDSPWYTYYAVFGLCIYRAFPEDGLMKKQWVDNVLSYEHSLSPQDTRLNRNYRTSSQLTFKGPNCGADPQTSVRQHLYTLYMSGAQMVTFESDSHRLRYAKYDTPRQDPLLTAVNNDRYFLSPFVKVLEEVYDYTRRQPRGVPYAPVAILVDKRHGCVTRFNNNYFTFTPMTRGDLQIPAILNHFFPFDRYSQNLTIGIRCKHLRDMPAEQNCMINLPYGNLMDIIASDIAPQKLQQYPVIIMAGEFQEPNKLATMLTDYVRQGGTLLLSSSQTKGFAPQDLGLKTTNANSNGKDREDLTPQAATVLKKAPNGTPLLLQQTCGQGRFLLGTEAHFLSPSRSKNPDDPIPMTATFAETVAKLIETHAPIQVRCLKGQVDHYLNILPDAYLVTLTNYDGITHLTGQPVTRDLTKTAEIQLIRNGKTVTGIDTITNRPMKTPAIHIAPGDIKIIRIPK